MEPEQITTKSNIRSKMCSEMRKILQENRIKRLFDGISQGYRRKLNHFSYTRRFKHLIYFEK